MSNKQSSVDWLIFELYDYQMAFYGTTFIPLRLIEQDKEMHKLEIKKSYDQGEVDLYLEETSIRTFKNSEQYYNETFKRLNNEQSTK